jgi:hypothetical protein
MVRGLSGFIGDGAGGALPSMGWTLKDFETFINRAETDTAFEAFLKRKKAQRDSEDSISVSEKRSATDDFNSSRKRARTSNGYEGQSDVDYTSNVGFVPSYNSEPPMNLFSNLRPGGNYTSNFLNSLAADPQGTNSFLAGTSTNMGYTAANPNNRDVYPSSYQSSATSPSHPPNSASSVQNRPYMQVSGGGPPSQSGGVDDVSTDDPKSQEARKLVA